MVKDRQRPSTGSFSVRSPTKNSFSQGSRDNNNSFSLPNINIPSPSSSSSQSPHKLSTMIDQELISTLSTKPVSLRRKVMTKLMKKKKNPAFDRYKYYLNHPTTAILSHPRIMYSSHISPSSHYRIVHIIFTSISSSPPSHTSRIYSTSQPTILPQLQRYLLSSPHIPTFTHIYSSQPDLLSLKPDASYMKKGEKVGHTLPRNSTCRYVLSFCFPVLNSSLLHLSTHYQLYQHRSIPPERMV